jgi:hypothetical protein
MAYGRESNNIESNNIWLIYEPKVQEKRAKIGPQINASIPKQGRQQYPAPFKDPLDLIS